MNQFLASEEYFPGLWTHHRICICIANRSRFYLNVNFPKLKSIIGSYWFSISTCSLESFDSVQTFTAGTGVLGHGIEKSCFIDCIVNLLRILFFHYFLRILVIWTISFTFPSIYKIVLFSFREIQKKWMNR